MLLTVTSDHQRDISEQGRYGQCMGNCVHYIHFHSTLGTRTPLYICAKDVSFRSRGPRPTRHESCKRTITTSDQVPVDHELQTLPAFNRQRRAAWPVPTIWICLPSCRLSHIISHQSPADIMLHLLDVSAASGSELRAGRPGISGRLMLHKASRSQKPHLADRHEESERGGYQTR